ncbi:MAG: AzlC family ABC transporter permease [Firmicutes bacterium]|nr:AzlC family ABC transporter permease [Bacillota bacterium]
MKQPTKPHNPIASAFLAAFPLTLPVMAGYFFLGLAYGVLMSAAKVNPLWTFLSSLLVFAGSLQYVALSFFAASFNPLFVLLMALMVNVRHLFYGLSLLDRIHGAGKYKPYIVFALTDESFSLLSSAEPPEGADRGAFLFFVCLLDQCYWVISSMLGALFGALVKFNTSGLDFALTALFVVLFLNRVTDKKNRVSAVIGVACSVACLLIFGPADFILPSMAAMLAVFAFSAKRLTPDVGEVSPE